MCLSHGGAWGQRGALGTLTPTHLMSSRRLPYPSATCSQRIKISFKKESRFNPSVFENGLFPYPAFGMASQPGRCTSPQNGLSCCSRGSHAGTERPTELPCSYFIFYWLFFFSLFPPILPFLHHDSLGPQQNIWPSHFWFHLLADNLFVDQKGKETQLFRGGVLVGPLVVLLKHELLRCDPDPGKSNTDLPFGSRAVRSQSKRTEGNHSNAHSVSIIGVIRSLGIFGGIHSLHTLPEQLPLGERN